MTRSVLRCSVLLRFWIDGLLDLVCDLSRFKRLLSLYPPNHHVELFL